MDSQKHSDSLTRRKRGVWSSGVTLNGVKIHSFFFPFFEAGRPRFAGSKGAGGFAAVAALTASAIFSEDGVIVSTTSCPGGYGT